MTASLTLRRQTSATADNARADLKLLGRRLLSGATEASVTQVDHPDEVELLRSLSLDGIHSFAERYGMEVKCRARGAAFDFIRKEA